MGARPPRRMAAVADPSGSTHTHRKRMRGSRPGPSSSGVMGSAPIARVLFSARLFKHVFDIDLEYGPNCGGELKIIKVILWCEPGRQRCRGPLWASRTPGRPRPGHRSVGR
jgi:hypothetical protein